MGYKSYLRTGGSSFAAVQTLHHHSNHACVLAYWDIRGLAHPIRMLLKYAGEEFEDKRYDVTVSDGPNGPVYNRDSWLNEKFTLGLDFPNLPYFIDGDVKIVQTNAILRTIARKHDLCGVTAAEKAHVDMCADAIMDFRNGFVRLCYGPRFADNEPVYRKDLPAKLKPFEEYLGDKKFLVGDKPTFPDFHLYEMLDQHVIFEPSCLEAYPKLQAYKQRFEALPAIKAFKEDPKNNVPMNNKMAGFGSKI